MQHPQFSAVGVALAASQLDGADEVGDGLCAGAGRGAGPDRCRPIGGVPLSAPAGPVTGTTGCDASWPTLAIAGSHLDKTFGYVNWLTSRPEN